MDKQKEAIIVEIGFRNIRFGGCAMMAVGGIIMAVVLLQAGFLLHLFHVQEMKELEYGEGFFLALGVSGIAFGLCMILYAEWKLQ